MECKKDDPYIGFSHCFVCARKYADQQAGMVLSLETQVKALEVERDRARRERDDFQHKYAGAMLDISTACKGTTARSACEVVELWRKERDDLAEAVRVLAAEVNAAWNWNDTPYFDRPETWPHTTAEAVRNNPIAAAALNPTYTPPTQGQSNPIDNGGSS